MLLLSSKTKEARYWIAQSCLFDLGLPSSRLLLREEKTKCYHLVFLFHSDQYDASSYISQSPLDIIS